MAKRGRVRRVFPPKESVIADLYSGAYLLDGYAVDLRRSDKTMQDRAELAPGKPPLWFRSLLAETRSCDHEREDLPRVAYVPADRRPHRVLFP